MNPNGFAMGLGGITLVRDPIVLRVIGGHGLHVLIPVGLGQDARRGDGQETPISLDFAGMRK